jgi:hypothetical protein
MSEPTPQVGDVIYVDRGDLTSGTWVRGGRATVSRVLSDWRGTFVKVIEVPGTKWNWEFLSPKQPTLQAEYGDVIAGQKMIGNREWK